MEEDGWKCPYCGSLQILQKSQNEVIKKFIKDKEEYYDLVSISKYGEIGLRLHSIACLKCKELTLKIDLAKAGCDKHKHPEHSGYLKSEYYLKDPIKSWSLMPDSRAKPQPEYIPKNIREGYEEACKVADLSPKASAILARKCLEAMIKDFCKIKGSKNLATMIEEIKKTNTNSRVTEGSIEAIDHIRKQGNIAAHIKQPTNELINDISKEDSDLLIELLEMLFQEWYIDSHKRKVRLSEIKKRKSKSSSKTQKTKQDSQKPSSLSST